MILALIVCFIANVYIVRVTQTIYSILVRLFSCVVFFRYVCLLNHVSHLTFYYIFNTVFFILRVFHVFSLVRNKLYIHTISKQLHNRV